MRETTMGNSIRICTERGDDFFLGSHVQAEKPEVWGAFEEDSGRAAGVFSAGARRVFLNGDVRDVRYLSDLRIRPEYRRGLVLARGFRILREHVFAEGEWAQTLVLDDNAEAATVLTSGRAGLPDYRPCGRFRTWIFRPQKVRNTGGGIRVRTAGPSDVSAIQALQEREASTAAFTPWLDLDRMHTPEFRLAYHKDALVGMIGIWDTSSYRQTRIDGYGLGIRLARPFANVWAALRNLPRLPCEGSTIRMKAITAVLCRDRDPQILRALLASVLNAGGLYGITLDVRDPLADALRGIRAHRATAAHYLVGFSGTPPRVDEPLYFDFARL